MKKICLLHANCQGEPLAELLMLSAEFRGEYELYRFTNYTREFIPDNIINNCDLFLYQTLGDNWGNHSSAKLCARLKSSASSIAIPNMRFLHYWPLWSSEPGFDYRDKFLDSLLDRGLNESQILHLCMNTKLTNIYNLNEILEQSEQIERDKEKLTPIKYVDWMLEHYKQIPLYNTINHPRTELLFLMANGTLKELGIDPLSNQDISAFPPPFADFEQPIHPQVAEYLGLEFGGPQQRYHVYGAELTFEEYAMRYIKCRKNSIDDFIGFLIAAARMGKN